MIENTKELLRMSSRTTRTMSSGELLPVTARIKSFTGYDYKYQVLWQRAFRKVKCAITIKKILRFSKTKSPFENIEIDSAIPNKSDVIIKPSTPLFIFHPQSRTYFIWLGIMSAVLLYLAILDPFISIFLDYNSSPTVLSSDTFIDFVFILDFFITLNLAYYNDEGALITDHRSIILNYFKGWMLVDMATSIPLGLITALQGGSRNSSGLIKLIRLRNVPKLVRLTRLLKMLQQFMFIEDIEYIFSTYQKSFRILKAAFVAFLSMHIIACLFYLMAKIDEFGPDTWISRYKLTELTASQKYLTSLYWALTTLATIGYGDISPRTFAEKGLAMIWMIVGVFVVSFTAGILSSFYSDLNAKDNLIYSKTLLAERFASNAGISKKEEYLLKRTIRGLNFRIGSQQITQVIKGVPLALRYEIAMSIYSKALTKLEFFHKKPKAFVADVALRLEYASFQADKVIFRANEISSEIYFIIEGKVKYLSQDLIISIMQDGHYFGDIEVVFDVERKYDAVCIEDAKLLRITAKIVEFIRENYPHVWEDMKKAAKIRYKNLTQNLAEMNAIRRINRAGMIKKVSFTDLKEQAESCFNQICSERQGKKCKKQSWRNLKKKLKETEDYIEEVEGLIEVLSF